MIGMKVVGPGSTAGWTANDVANGVMSVGGVGTPMKVQKGRDVMKPKEVTSVYKGQEYNWEDNGEQGGVTGKIADWLVS
jgi:hypothetical protein